MSQNGDMNEAAPREAPLVSVIIPAFNAAETIAETLISVRTQTYQKLEIIVVDDGSRDDTATIADAHAALDSRIKVLRQLNAGVAAARNAGIATAGGQLIAPVDADDLWAPTNIARQVAAFTEAGEGATMVFSWHARIDENGRITAYSRNLVRPGEESKAMCRRNLVGHGSGALMCKAAVLDAGGYDPSLRSRGAQGAEDYKLYLELAVRGRCVLIPEVLVGYRVTQGNMSSDVTQMCRSAFLVLDEFSQRYPRLRHDLAIGRRICAKWYMTRALEGGRFRQMLRVFESFIGEDPPGAALLIVETPFRLVRRTLRKTWWRAKGLAVPNTRAGAKRPNFIVGSIEA